MDEDGEAILFICFYLFVISINSDNNSAYCEEESKVFIELMLHNLIEQQFEKNIVL